ncbi:MAG TPA: nucleoside hydrolase [Thermomicrobiales bacterium]|nr:nucleoside hydrolase [Thermomicrobiales bacterium]
MPATHRVIFDTDIGTDVDDILALGVLLGSPEVTLEGVTTVYGDVDLRARMVRKLLQLRGVEGIPVYTGVSNPILGLDPIYWPGHEGVGLLSDDDQFDPLSDGHAVDYLVDTIATNPGEITLLAVGPLTNVAAALIREPGIATAVKRLVIMGGRIGINETGWGVGEHNIKCDPEAAHIVFSSGAPIELVPLDVTLRAVIRQDGVDMLNAIGTPYHAALADQVARYPGFVARGGSTFLHDPLAALAVVQPDSLTWTPVHLQVELDGRTTRAMTVARTPSAEAPVTAQVALDLDPEACEARILERLTS